MNRYDTETNGPLDDSTPLFSSVWLALFSELRKNFNQRRIIANSDANADRLNAMKIK